VAGNAASKRVDQPRNISCHTRRQKAAKWNGREIRNAFQTAIALAEYDALHESDREEIDVELSHFQNVVKLSANFRK
jgi:hypothetical protein